MNKQLFFLLTLIALIISACAPGGNANDPAFAAPNASSAIEQTVQAHTGNPTNTPNVASTIEAGVASTLNALGTNPTVQATHATPTNTPTNAPVQATAQPLQNAGTNTCSFAAPGNLDNMPKTLIELAAQGTWFHRVYNARLFNEQNGWGGADSWNNMYALGPNSGGAWTSHGNPGQFVYRGTSTHLQWCLGVFTSSKYFDEFMAGSTATDAAINVRIAPFSNVTVVTASGKTITQETSDMGDITIILPKDGVIVISVDYTTAAPTHESLVWVGPYDRSKHINTIDAR